MGGTTFISDGMCLYNHSHCLFKRMQRCQKTTFAKGVSSQFLFALAIAHFNPLLLFVVARLFFPKRTAFLCFCARHKAAMSALKWSVRAWRKSTDWDPPTTWEAPRVSDAFLRTPVPRNSAQGQVNGFDKSDLAVRFASTSITTVSVHFHYNWPRNHASACFTFTTSLDILWPCDVTDLGGSVTRHETIWVGLWGPLR